MLKQVSIKRRAILICTLAAIFYCYEYYLRVAPSIISQELMSTFDISNAGLGVLSAFFYYAYMPAQIPVGLLIDKYGPRLVLAISCVLCVLGNYMFASTNTLWIAQIGRFILGFGSAFAFIGFLKICNNWLPHKYYALMVGFCMLLGMIGAIGGEMLLTSLVTGMRWQTALELAAWAGLVIAVLIWLLVRDTPPTTKNTSEHKALTNTEYLRLGLKHNFKNPQIWLISIIGCCTFLPLSSFAEMWAVPYLETVGYNRTNAAYGSSMIFLGFGIGGPMWGLISIWLASRRTPLVLGSLVSAISATLIIWQPNMPVFYMYSFLFMLGFFASTEILVFAIGNDITTKRTSGITAAIINMIVMFGGIILQPLIGEILDLISSNTVSEYQTALLILPVSLFISAVLSYAMEETYRV